MAGHQKFSEDKIGAISKFSSTVVKLAASTVTLGGLQYDTAVLQILTATSGVGGIDTGVLNNEVTYYVYAVLDGSDAALVASESTTSPSGFTTYRKVGAFITESGGAIDTAHSFGSAGAGVVQEIRKTGTANLAAAKLGATYTFSNNASNFITADYDITNLFDEATGILQPVRDANGVHYLALKNCAVVMDQTCQGSAGWGNFWCRIIGGGGGEGILGGNSSTSGTTGTGQGSFRLLAGDELRLGTHASGSAGFSNIFKMQITATGPASSFDWTL